jgi:hypothetical protein
MSMGCSIPACMARPRIASLATTPQDRGGFQLSGVKLPTGVDVVVVAIPYSSDDFRHFDDYLSPCE